MTKRILLLLGGFFISISAFALHSWNGRIIQVATREDISINKLTAEVSLSQIIILGEKHNTVAIQHAQSKIINDVVLAAHQIGRFSTAWEFLNYTDQAKINLIYERYLSDQIDGLGFLTEIQGNTHNASYVPILETTKNLQGNIVGVNIPREAKQPVIEGGIEAVDPQYLPPNFAMGGAGYHDRFIEAMGDHSPPQKLENYFAAQCLTDDIMAYTLQKNFNMPLQFLITGSFHTEYYDAVVNRIKIRMPEKSISVIRLIDAADYDQQELDDMLPAILHDKVYGDIADYVYFVNEPLNGQQ